MVRTATSGLQNKADETVSEEYLIECIILPIYGDRAVCIHAHMSIFYCALYYHAERIFISGYTLLNIQSLNARKWPP